MIQLPRGGSMRFGHYTDPECPAHHKIQRSGKCFECGKRLQEYKGFGE